LREALKLKSDLTVARDYLGVSLAESGQCREALPHLKRSAGRVSEPHFKRAVGLGGVRCAMAGGQPDEAVDFVRRLNRELPNDPEVLYLSAHVYSDLSIHASQQLLFKAPSSYQVRLLNAEALETQGRWDDAAAEYRQILTTNPQLPGIHYRLGRLLLSAPKTATTLDDAKREFEEELKIDPRNAGAAYVLGELARKARQWPQAIQHFSLAAKCNPNFADAFIGWGKSLVSAGRPAEAVVPLETAVKLQPDNPVGHFQLATAYRRAGRTEEAERQFAAHRQVSEKARQSTENIQKVVLGPPQTAEPPD
jgi:tetratricopeptide (TPR) repeat protein